MKTIFVEYGKLIVIALVFLAVVANGFTDKYGSSKGLLGAAGDSARITGGADAGISEASAIIAGNSGTYTLTQVSDKIPTNRTVPLTDIAVSTDSTAVVSVAKVTDEYGADALENGKVVYDRRTHTLRAVSRGVYDIEMRFSGRQLMRNAFRVTAL